MGSNYYYEYSISLTDSVDPDPECRKNLSMEKSRISDQNSVKITSPPSPNPFLTKFMDF